MESEKQVRLEKESWEKLKIMSVKENKSMKKLIKEMINDRENNNKQQKNHS